MLDKRSLLLAGTLCAATLSLSACSSEKEAGKNGRGAPEVGFVVARVEAVPVTTSLGGRTVAFETSEVRPQVNGLIRRRLFTEGGFVRAGQPLYQIDASLYQAAADQAAAIPHIDYVREAGSEGIELVMWLIARGAMADAAGGPRPKVAHRFFHVPASNTAVGHLILENN